MPVTLFLSVSEDNFLFCATLTPMDSHVFQTMISVTLRWPLMVSLFWLLSGCTSITNHQENEQASSNSAVAGQKKQDVINWPCLGSIGAPPSFAGKLTKVEFPDSFKSAIGEPTKGGLCQAQAFKVNDGFEIFRGWNATYTKGKLGKWWTFTLPSKSIASYRKNYAICPKYSPLDMLVRCTLKEGTILALGTGQSAKCNQYLTYDISPAIQIYLPDAAEATMDCETYQGNFAWEATPAIQPLEEANDTSEKAF